MVLLLSDTLNNDRSLTIASRDSHIHVIDPETFPLDPDREYTPKPARKFNASAYESERGIAHPVIVQPSVYGFDNSALIGKNSQRGPYLEKWPWC